MLSLAKHIKITLSLWILHWSKTVFSNGSRGAVSNTTDSS